MASERKQEDLKAFIIPDVMTTGKELGRGSWGTVQEVNVDGVICAAKTPHSGLISHHEGWRVLDMHYRECGLHSQLRHPHIVQFLGICFLPDTPRLPALVTELLQYDLGDVLDNLKHHMPFTAKVSILQDVAKGLIHLHKRKLLHRNLTARNILLNTGMTAKIIDFGMSCVEKSKYATMTKAPGNVLYTPPEALEDNPWYGPPLDIFSFGVLCLYVAIQEIPHNLLPPTYADPQIQKVYARSELERREQYMKKLYYILHEKHPLVSMIAACLHNMPEKRLTATQVLEELIKIEQEGSDEQIEFVKLQLQKSLIEMQLGIQPQYGANRLQKILFKELKLYSKSVELTGTCLGAGSYGEVMEVKYGDKILAAKCFREIDVHDADMYVKIFCRKVIILLKLQHQNILKYEGICFLSKEQQIPSLLMERMSFSLHHYLVQPENKECSLGCKAEILRDIANGLKFLHSQQPAIIHRDLSATNILLDDKLTAKIADFGNARVVDLNPMATPQTMTAHLGTPHYMPPEVYEMSSELSDKLDIFSFGHLLLFTIVQELVDVRAPTYTHREKLKARSEVERRGKHVAVAQKLLGDRHVLLNITTRCLDLNAAKRPSASDIYRTLHKLANDLQDKKLGEFKTLSPFLYCVDTGTLA